MPNTKSDPNFTPSSIQYVHGSVSTSCLPARIPRNTLLVKCVIRPVRSAICPLITRFLEFSLTGECSDCTFFFYSRVIELRARCQRMILSGFCWTEHFPKRTIYGSMIMRWGSLLKRKETRMYTPFWIMNACVTLFALKQRKQFFFCYVCSFCLFTVVRCHSLSFWIVVVAANPLTTVFPLKHRQGNPRKFWFRPVYLSNQYKHICEKLPADLLTSSNQSPLALHTLNIFVPLWM